MPSLSKSIIPCLLRDTAAFLEIAKATARDVSPMPLEIFRKVTTPLYVPVPRLFPLLLIETVTVMLAPAARVPELAESVIQLWALEAVQLIDDLPLFCRV